MKSKDVRSHDFLHRFFQPWKMIAFALVGLTLIMTAVFMTSVPRSHKVDAASAGLAGDWPMYMDNNGRSGYNTNETLINPTSAPNLKVKWTAPGGGMIFSQPVVANGIVYWGTFDGYEHATTLSGQQVWQQYLGITTTCAPYQPLGVVSSATVNTVNINGKTTTVVFVGGGDDHLYALNALTGAVIWSQPIGNASTNTFLWDSPFVYNNTVYIGTATTGEAQQCKLVAGQLDALDAATGNVLRVYNTVPAGCVGGGIWSSPTLDTASGSIFFTGGTQGNCKTDKTSIGITKIRAANFKYQSSWQIPVAQRLTNDADFAGTPTLFTATINGVLHKMVGAVDKNGYYYAFDRNNLSKGPLWSKQIAGAGACPQCGQGSISSAVWDGTRLFVAGGTTTINGASCGGSVRALDPATGNFLWEACLPKTVMGAISEVPGVIAVVNTPGLTLLNTVTGAKLFTANQDHFYGSVSISNGVMYAGTTSGTLYAFGL